MHEFDTSNTLNVYKALTAFNLRGYVLHWSCYYVLSGALVALGDRRAVG